MTTWEKFREKFSIDEKGCWVAKTTPNSSGYCSIFFEEEVRSGYSVTFEVMSGRRLKRGNTTELHHKCENRKCWNPFHIEEKLVSEHRSEAAFNGADGTYNCPQGHVMSEENTYKWTNKSGYPSRHCKICRQVARDKYNQKIKGE